LGIRIQRGPPREKGKLGEKMPKGPEKPPEPNREKPRELSGHTGTIQKA